jgi:hypothetical protein
MPWPPASQLGMVSCAERQYAPGDAPYDSRDCRADTSSTPIMLHNWTNFFPTTAAVGAQLIGLLFVVVTVGTGLSRSQSVAGIRAFLTPTLTCFSGVLLQALVVLVLGHQIGQGVPFWSRAGWRALFITST